MLSKKLKSVWKTNGELIFTLLGVISGIGLGFMLRVFDPDPKVIAYINFPGEILMNSLKLMILPLIVASLISGKFAAESRIHPFLRDDLIN